MHRSFFFIAILTLAAAALPARAADEAAPAFEQSEDRIIYALGLSIAERLGDFELDERELALVQAGLADGLRKDGEPRVSLRMWGHRVEGLRRNRMKQTAEREKKLGREYLEQASGEEGAVKTESDLVYRELVAGEGARPTESDRVRVHYHGTLRDGTVFDSSVERGRPSTFGLKGVIPCWTEALQRMRVGGKSRLICPPEIAYGERGMPGKIKPGAVLTFEVELLEVLPKEPPASLR